MVEPEAGSVVGSCATLPGARCTLNLRGARCISFVMSWLLFCLTSAIFAAGVSAQDMSYNVDDQDVTYEVATGEASFSVTIYGDEDGVRRGCCRPRALRHLRYGGIFSTIALRKLA